MNMYENVELNTIEKILDFDKKVKEKTKEIIVKNCEYKMSNIKD